MELRKINLENIDEVLALKVAKKQESFVAPNTASIIEAYATISSGYAAYPFGIYENDTPIGFVMFGYDTTEDKYEPEIAKGNYCLWRFMIDEKFQHKGLGKKALELCLNYLKEYPWGKAEYCWLSYEPENERARKLYHQAGFAENGEMCGDEIIAVLKLQA